MLSLPVGCLRNQIRPLWHGFAALVRRWDFTLPGELGDERNYTDMMPTLWCRERGHMTTSALERAVKDEEQG